VSTPKDYNNVKNSLLYELRESDDCDFLIDQLFLDSNNETINKEIFILDSDDILAHIDPFGLIHQANENRYTSNLADNFFSFQSLFDNKKRILFLLKEYIEEFSRHTAKFDSYISALHRYETSKLIQHITGLNYKKDIATFISENYSLINYGRYRYNKSITDIYDQVFKKIIKEPEEDYSSYNFDKKDIDRIKMLFKLFDGHGLNNIYDSYAFYKTIIKNKNAQNGEKYYYFSSAQKSLNLVKKLKVEIGNNKWNWLNEILNKFPNEESIFFRNRATNFALEIFNLFKNDFNNVDEAQYEFRKVIKDLSSDFPISDDNKNFEIISSIIFKLRERIENKAIFIKNGSENKKLKSELEGGRFAKNKNFETLLYDLFKYRTEQKNLKVSFLNFNVSSFTISLLKELILFCSTNKSLYIDRGKDSIISLLNSTPPLFVFNKEVRFKDDFLEIKTKIQELILFASSEKTEMTRIKGEVFRKFLKTIGETNLSFANNLALIFLLILIKYESPEGEDSNLIAYRLCLELEKKLEDRRDSIRKVSNKEEYLNKLEFYIQELNVLKIWSFRRIGNNSNQNNLTQLNEYLKEKYKSDYRFSYSSFLSKLNSFYSYKVNINEEDKLISFIDLILEEGKATYTLLERENYENNDFFRYSIQTLLNSLCFVNCIKLDLLLHKSSMENGKNFLKIIKEDRVRELFEDDILKLKKAIRQIAVRNFERTPVLAYVEAYVEYFEAIINNNREKLNEAIKVLERGSNNKDEDRSNRSFFYYCYDMMYNLLISVDNKNFTEKYESFIMKIDDRETFQRNRRK